MPSLISLPVELILMIAGHCAARDILSFSRTCRSLREICDDAIVYETCFKNHLLKPTSTTFTTKSALVKAIKALINEPKVYAQPKKEWLCLAAAMCQVPEALLRLRRIALYVHPFDLVRHERHEQIGKSMKGPLGFIVTLQVWGCLMPWFSPEFFDNLEIFLARRQRHNHGSESFVEFAFLSVMNTLETHRAGSPLEIDLQYARKYYLAEPSVFATNRLREPREGNIGGIKTWRFRQTWALIIGDRMARVMYTSSMVRTTGNFVFDPTIGTDRWVIVDSPAYLPSSKKIEFVDLLDGQGKNAGKEKVENLSLTGYTNHSGLLPLVNTELLGEGKRGRYFQPFCGWKWSSWNYWRCVQLSKSLDKGEWCCSFVHLRGRQIFVEPTLVGLRFQKTADGENRYSTQVPDGIGANRLRGDVFFTRYFHFTLENPPQVDKRQTLKGTVTPVGILGASLRDNGLVVGLFWIWKKEWMDDVVD